MLTPLLCNVLCPHPDLLHWLNLQVFKIVRHLDDLHPQGRFIDQPPLLDATPPCSSLHFFLRCPHCK